MGQHFPHKFRTCAKWLADSTPPAIADRFGFANVEEAAFVQKRARSLMDLGFEGAVKQAQSELVADTHHGNKATIYKWPEPCCNLEEWRGASTRSSPPPPPPPNPRQRLDTHKVKVHSPALVSFESLSPPIMSV